MTLTIRWLNSPPNLWQETYQKVKNANFLQSQIYSISQAQLNSQKLRWAVIEKGSEIIGCFQIQEAGILWNLIHAVILDRGPLWLQGYGSEEDQYEFARVFRKEFPARWGRKLRFIPEMEDRPQTKELLEQAGFQHRAGSKYQTEILDLEKPADDIRAAFKKRWRNALSKAERENLKIEWDEKGEHLNWLLKAYVIDRKAKGYDGPSVKLIYELAKHAIPRGDMWIARAIKDDKPVGAVLIFRHGLGATYQIGWNSNDGREYGAHYILLWEAILKLKETGIATFDLGGTNDDTAKGVKAFKEGLGGRTLILPGIYN